MSKFSVVHLGVFLLMKNLDLYVGKKDLNDIIPFILDIPLFATCDVREKYYIVFHDFDVTCDVTRQKHDQIQLGSSDACSAA